MNNNSATNGGYNFTGYKWFKNGTEISDKQYYSAGPQESDVLDKDAEYHVELTTSTGEVLRTCAVQVALKGMGIKAYPNPVRSNESMYIDVDIDQDMMGNAVIEVYNIMGTKVASKKVEGRTTAINLPHPTGTYLIKVRSGDFVTDSKVVIK